MSNARKPTITTRAFQRSYGDKKPRPSMVASWSFQASRSVDAYDDDLYGPVLTIHAVMYVDAVSKAIWTFANDGAEYMAVLP